MEFIINLTLLSLLAMTAIAIVRIKDLFAVAMLAGLYGLLSASFFVMMDAVDVAFTEASVGAGISTLLMLTTLAITGRYEKTSSACRPKLALGLVLLTGGLLIYGTMDMPSFGDPDTPVQQHVAPRYLNESATEIGIPNVVTSVLASYRAFDTLGEVVVIFTAGVGVLALLMRTELPRAGARTAVASASASMHEHMVLRVVAKMLIPLILLFGLYVQFHGEYGPRRRISGRSDLRLGILPVRHVVRIDCREARRQQHGCAGTVRSRSPSVWLSRHCFSSKRRQFPGLQCAIRRCDTCPARRDHCD